MSDFNKITYGVVALLVFVLIASATIIPIVQTAQSSVTTEEINSSERYAVTTPTESITLSCITVNDARVPAINGISMAEWLGYTPTRDTSFYVYSSDCICFTGYSVNTGWGTNWRIMSPSLAESGEPYQMNINNTYGYCQFSEGTVTYFFSEVTQYTSSYDFVLVPSAEGDLAAFEYSDLPKFVDSGVTIYAANNASTGGQVAHGTIDNMAFDFSLLRASGLFESAKITSVYEPTKYELSNSLTGFTVTDAAYNSITQVLIPLEYTTISENNDAVFKLLGIIPMLLFVVPIVMVVRLISNRSD